MSIIENIPVPFFTWGRVYHAEGGWSRISLCIINTQFDGLSNATNVVLTDTLPSEVQYITSIADQGSCVHNVGVVTCDLGDLTSGVSTTVIIVVTVDDSVLGAIENSVTVKGAEYDPNLSNNSDIEQTKVQTRIFLPIMIRTE